MADQEQTAKGPPVKRKYKARQGPPVPRKYKYKRRKVSPRPWPTKLPLGEPLAEHLLKWLHNDFRRPATWEPEPGAEWEPEPKPEPEPDNIFLGREAHGSPAEFDLAELLLTKFARLLKQKLWSYDDIEELRWRLVCMSHNRGMELPDAYDVVSGALEGTPAQCKEDMIKKSYGDVKDKLAAAAAAEVAQWRALALRAVKR